MLREKHKPIESRFPDLDILGALISMQRETGDAKAALSYARKAAEALPNDAAFKQLRKDLETEQ